MSLSSESEPPYNEFYDKNEVSDGESEGFIDRTIKKPPPNKRRETRPETASFLSGLLAPFEGCCFSKGSPGPASHPSARLSGPLSEFVLQTYELPEESGGGLSDDSSSGDDIALGVTAKTYKHTKERKSRETLNDITLLRERVESENIKWQNLSSTVELDQTTRWIVVLPLLQSIDLGLLQLSNDQKRLAALYWCRSVTLSQKMTPKLLEKIISVSRWEFPVEMTVEQALKKREEFGTLEFQQIIESRLIEEIMGEFEQQATADDPSSTFLVISKIRTVATVVRKQGDALLITVFDCGFSKDRGPAFLGFDKIKTAENFLIELFTNDPLVMKSSSKFSAWTINNKQLTGGLRYDELRARGVGGEVKPVWDSEQAEEQGDVADDAQHQARVAYTAMYKATDTPMDKERVFTHTAAGALQVKDKKR